MQEHGERSRGETIQSAIERNRVLTDPRGMEQFVGTARGTADGARPGGAEATLNAREFAEKFLGIKGPELDRLMEMFAFAGGEKPKTRGAINISNIVATFGDPMVEAGAEVFTGIFGGRVPQRIRPTEQVMFGPAGGKMDVLREELADLKQLISGIAQALRQRAEEGREPAVQMANPIFNFNHPITPDSQTTDRDDTEGSP